MFFHIVNFCGSNPHVDEQEPRKKNLKEILLYLSKLVFTHGRLYVALSCVRTKSGMTIIQEKCLHLLN